MAEGIPARLTAAEGRRFSFTLGIAFLVFAALLLWRGKVTRAEALGVVGGLFVLAGLLVPTQLGPVERAWMGLAHVLSKITTPVFMAVVYFIVITPIGALRRLFGGTPLRPKGRPDSMWIQHEPAVPVPESLERQF